MWRVAASAIAATIAAPMCAHPAQARCPERPPGLSAADGPGGRQFFATAGAEALADDDGSRDLAATEARLSAKVLLRDDTRVPKSAAGRLRGATQTGACVDGSIVYVTIMVDETNARRAAALEDAIGASIHSSPTPQFGPAR